MSARRLTMQEMVEQYPELVPMTMETWRRFDKKMRKDIRRNKRAMTELAARCLLNDLGRQDVKPKAPTPRALGGRPWASPPAFAVICRTALH